LTKSPGYVTIETIDRLYGQGSESSDGRSIYDTKAAFQEIKANNIHPFCLTVDLAGKDCLRKIGAESEYLVIEEATDLPRVLPKIYHRPTT
jgi:nitric oxide reductase NorD protein